MNHRRWMKFNLRIDESVPNPMSKLKIHKAQYFGVFSLISFRVQMFHSFKFHFVWPKWKKKMFKLNVGRRCASAKRREIDARNEFGTCLILQANVIGREIQWAPIEPRPMKVAQGEPATCTFPLVI